MRYYYLLLSKMKSMNVPSLDYKHVRRQWIFRSAYLFLPGYHWGTHEFVIIQVVGGKMTDLGRLGAFITKVKKGSLADVVGHLRAGNFSLFHITSLFSLYKLMGFRCVSSLYVNCHQIILKHGYSSFPGENVLQFIYRGLYISSN